MPTALSSRFGKLAYWLVGVLVLAAVYFGVARLGLSLTAVAKQVSAVWPATGVALAALLFFGYRYWPGIALGALLANLTADEPLAVASGIALGNTLEALVGAWLLMRVARFDRAMERLQDVLALVILGAMLSTMISATIGVISLSLGTKQAQPFDRLWMEWWLGDAMGALVVAPVLLTWGTAPRRRVPGSMAEAVLLLLCLASVGSWVFAGKWLSGHSAYVVFPFVVWAALRFEQRGATVVAATISALAITGAMLKTGPFTDPELADRLLRAQFFVGVVAITGLLLGAALSERRRAEASKRKSEDVTRALAEATTLAEAAPRIIHAICDNFAWQVGAMWLVDRGADVLRCIEFRQRGRAPFPRFEQVTRERWFLRGEGLPGRVWASRQPAWIADVVQDANFPRAAVAASEGLHGAFAFPIELSGEVLGVAEFFSPEIRQPDDDVLRMIEGIGSQIGQFIERKRAEVSLLAGAARTRAIVDAAYDAYIAMDDRGRIIDFNAQAAALLGWTPEEAIGRSLAETIIPERFREEHIQGLQRFLATGEGPVVGKRVELTALKRDGSEVPVELMVSAIRTGDGYFFSAFLHDISERRRTEDTFRFLAEASTSLASLVDFESTLQNLARLSVGFFADWCIVDVVQPDGSLRRVAISHGDPQRVQHVEELLRRFPEEADRGLGPLHVLQTAQAELLSDVSEDALRQFAVSDEHFQLLRALGLKSFICVPLMLRGKPFGIITFATAESGRRYGPEDLKIAQDVVHRAAVAIDNSKLYAELQQADRRKDEFLAMLAHELRNPLAPIRSGLDLLRMKGDDPELADWVHETMNQQVVHMVRLVDDLLDVSRIMRGKIQLRFEPVELKSIVTRALEVARPLLEAKRHAMLVRLPEEPIRIQADPVRLTQAVANLLNNAAKYTDEGGRIELTGEVVDGQLVLRVKDTGIGLTPEMQQQVFDLFAQADHSPERTQGGLGIGLTLVRSLVELHGGRVDAMSAGLGQGSEFIVQMPIMPWVDEAKTEANGPSAPEAEPLRLLVVDDNQAAAMMVSRLLQAQGHTTQMAHDGLAAVEMARQWRPDVVLLDIGLPGLSGYDVARQLRAQPEGDKLILIAVTGYGQLEDRQRSQEAGFDLHLVKPLSFDELKRAIGTLKERTAVAAP